MGSAVNLSAFPLPLDDELSVSGPRGTGGTRTEGSARYPETRVQFLVAAFPRRNLKTPVWIRRQKIFAELRLVRLTPLKGNTCVLRLLELNGIAASVGVQPGTPLNRFISLGNADFVHGGKNRDKFDFNEASRAVTELKCQLNRRLVPSADVLPSAAGEK